MYLVKVMTRQGVTLILNTNDKFVVATNQARKFRSPLQASDYMRRLPTWDNPIACQPWIEGPRGGEYHIASGKKRR